MHSFIINIDMNVNDLSKQKIFLLFMLKACGDAMMCSHTRIADFLTNFVNIPKRTRAQIIIVLVLLFASQIMVDFIRWSFKHFHSIDVKNLSGA